MKIDLKKVPKRTIGEVQRNFKNSCVSCKFCNISPNKNPEDSRCIKFREDINHFNEGCSLWELDKCLKPLMQKHINYLVDSPIVK